MLRKIGEHRIIAVTAAFFILFILLSADYYALSVKQTNVRAAEKNAELTIRAEDSQGTIYDREMRPLVNAGSKYIAAVVPSAVDTAETAEYAVDKADFLERCSKGEPFTFECVKGRRIPLGWYRRRRYRVRLRQHSQE